MSGYRGGARRRFLKQSARACGLALASMPAIIRAQRTSPALRAQREQSAGLPAWMFKSPGVLYAVGEWIAIPNTQVTRMHTQGSGWNPDDPDTGRCQSPGGLGIRQGNYVGMVRGYSGAALRWKGSWLILHGAGHTVSMATRAVTIQLNTDVPAWESLAWSSPPSVIQGTPGSAPCFGPGGQPYAGQATYLDGMNAGGHSGYRNQFLQALDKFVESGGVSIIGSGGGSEIRTFDWSAKGTRDSTTGWNQPGQFPRHGGSGYHIACTHALREGVDEIFFWNDDGVYRWRHPEARLTRFAPIGSYGYGRFGLQASCYDSARDRLVMLYHMTETPKGTPDPLRNKWVIINCSTGAVSSAPNLGLAIPDNYLNPGMEYDPVIDRYFHFYDGHLWIVDPDTFTSSNYAQTGTIPPVPSNGMRCFNRIRYVPELGGLAYVNCKEDSPADTGVYFMRTH
jgi:hypothetical protein